MESIAARTPQAQLRSPDSGRFVVEGASVRGILWRIVPGMHLHLGFDPADQSFADSEVAAAWLAALNAPFIHAINRYSATVWYGGANWPTWRSWLRRQGVPVSAMHLGSSLPVAGARWMPFMSDAPRDAPDSLAARAMGSATTTASPAESAVVVAGEIVHPAPSATLRSAARALARSGVALARVTVDASDRVLSVDATPDVTDDAVLARVAARLAGVLHAHLRAW